MDNFEIIKQTKELEKEISANMKTIKKLGLLNSELERKYEQLQNEQYSKCNHIKICTHAEHGVKYYGCIKCGLNEFAVYRCVEGGVRHKTCFEDIEIRIMYHYLADNCCYNIKGQVIDGFRIDRLNPILFLKLAQEIYAKIKNNNPELDETELIELFNRACNEINENIKEDETREETAKRLKLI